MATFMCGQQGGPTTGGGSNTAFEPVSISFPGSPTINGTNTYATNKQVNFNTVGGTYPTGIANGIYYVSSTGLTTSSFEVSTAYNGTVQTYSGTPSGSFTSQAISYTFSSGQSMWLPAGYTPTVNGVATAINFGVAFANN